MWWGFYVRILECHRGGGGMCDLYGGLLLAMGLATKFGEFIGNVIIHDA